MVIGTGLFILLFPVADPVALALPVTALVNAVMAENFAAPYPARATIEISALPAGAEVEVEAVLGIGSS